MSLSARSAARLTAARRCGASRSRFPRSPRPNWNDFRVDHLARRHARRLQLPRRQHRQPVRAGARQPDRASRRRRAAMRPTGSSRRMGNGSGSPTRSGLSKVSVRGGEPQTILRWPGQEPAPAGFSWGPDGSILFGTAAGIQRVSASGGSAGAGHADRARHRRRGAYVAVAPARRPQARSSPSSAPTAPKAPGSSTSRRIGPRPRNPRHGFMYLAPGWLAFQQGATLLAVGVRSRQSHACRQPGACARERPHQAAGRTRRLARLHSDARRIRRHGSCGSIAQAGRPAVEGERLDYTHLDLAPDGRRALAQPAPAGKST